MNFYSKNVKAKILFQILKSKNVIYQICHNTNVHITYSKRCRSSGKMPHLTIVINENKYNKKDKKYNKSKSRILVKHSLLGNSGP